MVNFLGLFKLAMFLARQSMLSYWNNKNIIKGALSGYGIFWTSTNSLQLKEFGIKNTLIDFINLN